MQKRITWIVTFALLALIAYMVLWPVPVSPVSWVAPVAPGYTGAHAANQRLAGLQVIDLNNEEGPEHVAFDAAGNLIAADAYKGLLEIAPDGKVRMLADKIGGEPIRYANSIVVALNGLVYFTDSSMRFSPADLGGTFAASILDIIEQSATGRVLEYNPAKGTTRVVASGLSFANGIALFEDERWLIVAETGRYRVWKIAAPAADLDLGFGPSDQAVVLLDNLPGYPDIAPVGWHDLQCAA